MTSQKREADAALNPIEENKRLKPLIGGVKQLFNSSTFSDLTIVCQEKTWHVHKAIVCSQSDYFQKQCTGEFKEAKENKIKLNDDDAQVVDAVVHYLYNFDYGKPTDHGYEEAGSDTISASLFDIRVFALADRLFIAPLKELSAQKLAPHADAEWNTPGFAAAIAAVYNDIPENDDTLKQIILRVVKSHAKGLFDKSSAFDCFRKLVHQIPDFGEDIVSALARDAGPKTYRCPSCPHTCAYFEIFDTDGANFGCLRNHFVGNGKIWWKKYLVEE